VTGTPATQYSAPSSCSNRTLTQPPPFRRCWRGVGLGLVLTLVASAGCASKPPAQAAPALVSPPAFVVQWVDDLKIPSPRDNPVTGVFVREDKLFAYTKDGSSYVINRPDGLTIHVDEVPSGAARLHPPVLLKDRLVYPTTTALEVFDPRGVYLRSIPVQGSIASDAVGDGRSSVYVAVEIPGATRVCRYDMLKLANLPAPPLGERYPIEASRYNWALQAYHGGIPAAPAFFADVVYVAGEDGLVMAVATEDRNPIWPIDQENTPTQGMFNAMAPVVANLSADDSGLYVPAFDGRLYCINRISGQVKWQWFGNEPLDTPAILMSDTVYIHDPKLGIVAIDKVEPPNIPGKPSKPHYNRDPRWTSMAIIQVLTQDEHYTYATRKDNSIVALDKKNGESVFASRRNDFTTFATNTKDSTIYAATRDGHIVAIKAVTLPGIVGEVARRDDAQDRVGVALHQRGRNSIATSAMAMARVDEPRP
jgi:hypothetical protein